MVAMVAPKCFTDRTHALYRTRSLHRLVKMSNSSAKAKGQATGGVETGGRGTTGAAKAGGHVKSIASYHKGPAYEGDENLEDGEFYSLTSVGTLIVRIVAARNLPAAVGGGFFSNGHSNPYAILEFEGSVQGTSVVAHTLDPVWPREQYFFQVKMPVLHADEDREGEGGGGGTYSGRLPAGLKE